MKESDKKKPHRFITGLTNEEVQECLDCSNKEDKPVPEPELKELTPEEKKRLNKIFHVEED